jgi:hypothetical protein
MLFKLFALLFVALPGSLAAQNNPIITPDMVRELREANREDPFGPWGPFGGCRDARCGSDWIEEWLARQLAERLDRERIERIGNRKPKDCTAAICISERFEVYTTIVPGVSFDVKRCEAAICTTIEDPIVPDWLAWDIYEANHGNPFEGCKDSICVAPTGKVMGMDDESNADLEKIEAAKRRAEAEKAAAAEALRQKKAAAAAAKAAQKAADDAAAKAEQARKNQAKANAQAYENARTRLTAQAAEAANPPSNNSAQQARQRQQRADWEAMQDSAQAVAAAEQAHHAAEARAEAAQRALDQADNASYHATNSARFAVAVFMAEIGQNPNMSDYLAACRGAGQGCFQTVGQMFGGSGGKRPRPINGDRNP